MAGKDKQRILFLNPPSLDGRRINRHIMDPHVSKSAYLYPPYDFLMLSGWFHPSESWELRILDAMAEGLTAQQTLDETAAWQPKFILAMTAPQSQTMDLAFLKQLKGQAGCPLFTAGAVEHARKRTFLDQHDWIDGLLLEPISDDLLRYLEGDPGPFEGLVLRDRESLPMPRQRDKWFEVPVCRHDLIDTRLYSYPAMRTDRFTSLLTSYGCPFQCTYCEAPGFKFTMRTPELVLNELELIRDLGIREVCFKDWTFTANKKHGMAILDGMIDRDLGLQWFTFSRADVLDRELIRKMKHAGCTVIQMGVETVHTDILKHFKRKSNNEQIREVFAICREEGVETMVTLILGLPGDDEQAIRDTINFIIDLDPDFASFNIITPLLGSELRAEWEAAGYVDANVYENQDSTQASLQHLDISPKRLASLRDEAVRKFYFRPRYLAHRLRKTASLHQLLAQLKTGWSLFKQHVLHRAAS